MFELAIQELAGVLDRNSWVSQLSGILPLSALIDFIEIPPKLHILQLTAASPLWTWLVTPAGSRLLLSDDNALRRACYLDDYGNSVSLLGIDGRYGDRYIIANPETIRLCIGLQKPHIIANTQRNMHFDNVRIQNLDIIKVSRLEPHNRAKSASWLHYTVLDAWQRYSMRYLATSVLGWVILFVMITMSFLLGTYMASTFLAIVPLTGGVVFGLYAQSPRRLLNALPSTQTSYNRLILVAEHANAMNWTVFYGESTIVNALLNRPLEPQGPKISEARRYVLRALLRVLILGQWSLAIGSAATQDWNSYFISFWILFSIASQGYAIPVRRQAGDWMKSCANIQMERYQTQLSSRRALLNTVLALNPDTFSLVSNTGNTLQEDRLRFYNGAMKWIDPILEPGLNRSKWEKASLQAMNEAHLHGIDDKYPSSEWLRTYSEYWQPYILEGIEMAARIRQEAELPGRTVSPDLKD
ncbi:hypothetical protein BP5796_12801 [Coleophoma crateriformis]|uniref:Uncharacterized protein n=1 Tax=Coleophoma crateriformis TaxID=565419 RepID=A0A3D8Q6C0_9HELO|nr:hypothetical protein BP5796_12801 [Coleophoma crateriformis]